MPNAAHWGTPAAAAAGGPDVALRMPAAVDGFFAEELPPDARTPQNVLWMSRMVPFEEDTRSLLHVTLRTPTESTLWIVGISERCNMSVGGSGGGGALVPYSYVEITDETSCAVFVAIGGDALTVLPRGSRMSPSEPFLRLGAQGAPPDAGCGPQAIPLLLVPERRRRECSGHGSCSFGRDGVLSPLPTTVPLPRAGDGVHLSVHCVCAGGRGDDCGTAAPCSVTSLRDAVRCPEWLPRLASLPPADACSGHGSCALRDSASGTPWHVSAASARGAPAPWSLSDPLVVHNVSAVCTCAAGWYGDACESRDPHDLSGERHYAYEGTPRLPIWAVEPWQDDTSGPEFAFVGAFVFTGGGRGSGDVGADTFSGALSGVGFRGELVRTAWYGDVTRVSLMKGAWGNTVVHHEYPCPRNPRVMCDDPERATDPRKPVSRDDIAYSETLLLPVCVWLTATPWQACLPSTHPEYMELTVPQPGAPAGAPRVGRQYCTLQRVRGVYGGYLNALGHNAGGLWSVGELTAWGGDTHVPVSDARDVRGELGGGMKCSMCSVTPIETPHAEHYSYTECRAGGGGASRPRWYDLPHANRILLRDMGDGWPTLDTVLGSEPALRIRCASCGNSSDVRETRHVAPRAVWRGTWRGASDTPTMAARAFFPRRVVPCGPVDLAPYTAADAACPACASLDGVCGVVAGGGGGAGTPLRIPARGTLDLALRCTSSSAAGGGECATYCPETNVTGWPTGWPARVTLGGASGLRLLNFSLRAPVTLRVPPAARTNGACRCVRARARDPHPCPRSIGSGRCTLVASGPCATGALEAAEAASRAAGRNEDTWSCDAVLGAVVGVGPWATSSEAAAAAARVAGLPLLAAGAGSCSGGFTPLPGVCNESLGDSLHLAAGHYAGLAIACDCDPPLTGEQCEGVSSCPVTPVSSPDAWVLSAASDVDIVFGILADPLAPADTETRGDAGVCSGHGLCAVTAERGGLPPTLSPNVPNALAYGCLCAPGWVGANCGARAGSHHWLLATCGAVAPPSHRAPCSAHDLVLPLAAAAPHDYPEPAFAVWATWDGRATRPLNVTAAAAAAACRRAGGVLASTAAFRAAPMYARGVYVRWLRALHDETSYYRRLYSYRVCIDVSDTAAAGEPARFLMPRFGVLRRPSLTWSPPCVILAPPMCIRDTCAHDAHNPAVGLWFA